MKTYKVKITETLEKVVEVEAEDRDEAEQIVSDAWHNSEYILDAEDFLDELDEEIYSLRHAE